MDTRDLKLYQEWYGSLTKDQKNRYVKGLGSDRKYEVQAATVRGLAKKYLGKTISGCGFCLLSAHFELIKFDMANKKLKTEFALLAGVVLYDVVAKNFNKIMTAKNVTDDLALYHLSTNPECIKYFTRVPADLEQRLAAYKASDAVSKVLDAQAVAAEEKAKKAEDAYNKAQENADALKKEWQNLLEEAKKIKAGKAPKAAPKKEPKGDKKPETPKAPEKTEGKDNLTEDVRSFIEAGMSKEDVLSSYATEIESGMYSKEQIEKAYDGLSPKK